MLAIRVFALWGMQKKVKIFLITLWITLLGSALGLTVREMLRQTRQSQKVQSILPF